MNASQVPVDSIQVALESAAKLVAADPALAAEQAERVLKVAPRHPAATLILGAAHRSRGDAEAALAILEPLATARPGWVSAHYELGLAYGVAGRSNDAVAALRRALAISPEMMDAWAALGRHLTALGDTPGADAAYARMLEASAHDPRLADAAAALADDRLPVAERLLLEHLNRFPTDVAAICMLADVPARLRRYADAETLLVQCLELAPGFSTARYNLAQVLLLQHRYPEALREVERLKQANPTNSKTRRLEAVLLERLGEVQRSVEIYRQLLDEAPRDPKLWHSYGHACRTAERRSESVGAYRRAIELAPGFGEGYWGLANLKTFRFAADDVERMRVQLARSDLPIEDRVHFHFALGKALEDAEDYPRSFANYAAGNRLRRSVIVHDAEAVAERVRQTRYLFTREYVDSIRGRGAPAADPIFIVGMPRAGSTLVEQILSSHPAVEGTMELPDIGMIARDLGSRTDSSGVRGYPGILATLDGEELRAFGQRYLEGTRVHRKGGTPCFTDKMTSNWMHVGLIHSILPNAKIIDARRHPMSCCFSVFKQHFGWGNYFSYDLAELGRYYRDYVDLMTHFDQVMPGRVHRVLYERLVDDTETEVRRLLNYCGLPFDEACLRFYETKRTVRTASSEQVRQPIYRDALEQWKHYASWLGPLERALGPVIETHATSG